MKYELPKLNYGYDFLEPVIDTLTLEIHHSKHHQAYVNNLNSALEKYPEINYECAKELLMNIENIPDDIRQAVINNGGGHINHAMFWDSLTKPDTSKYQGTIKDKIDQDLGGFENFVQQFTKAATSRFGSGWAWLVLDQKGKLSVTSTKNQDSPLLENQTPLLGLDVWEHAYYLKYQNRRGDYIKEFFRVINWQTINARLEKALKASKN